MGRSPRILVPGLPHHVTQRGNRGADVFTSDAERQMYAAMLLKAVRRYRVHVWAYCLMTNHVHLVLVPATDEGISCVLHDVATLYSNWFNKRNAAPGHLWQGRFYSCVMDEPHLWAAVRYVERNPVRAGPVARAEEYAWSSAAAHSALRGDDLLSTDFPPPQVVRDWPAWLADEDVAMSNALRRATRFGRPCGSDSFVDSIGNLLDRRLLPRRGRRIRAREGRAPSFSLEVSNPPP